MEILKVIKIVWTNDKYWLFSSTLLRVLAGLIPVGTVIITEKIIQNIAAFLKEQNESEFSNIFLLLFIQFILSVFSSIIPSISNILDSSTERKLDFFLESKISTKASESPLYFFDNPNFYDHLQRIQISKGRRLLSPLTSILNVIQNLVSLCTVMIYILNVHWILFVLCVLTMLPVFIVEKVMGTQQFLLMIKQTPQSRFAQYLSFLLTNKQSALEIKIYNIKNFLLKKWSTIFLNQSMQELKLIKKREYALMLVSIFTSAIYLFGSLIVIKNLQNNMLGIGIFVATMQAFTESQRNLSQLSRNLGLINTEKMYIVDLFKFLNFEDKMENEEKQKYNFPYIIDRGITVNNLNFTYPYTNRQILKNISFNIKPGETIAIVGENGSGKSTLAKCLMGVYPVSDNSIFYEDYCINEIHKNEVFKNISIVAQDFMKFNLTVNENISFKDVIDREDEKEIVKIADNTNASQFIYKLKDHFNSPLGRIFPNGEELSIGQWQKIAIARSIYKSGQLYILDEPTASLDPLAELEVFEQFDKLSKQKTTIFITHRMASAKIADKVIVLKKGEIIGIGNHKELLESNKEYYEMYNSQAKWYA